MKKLILIWKKKSLWDGMLLLCYFWNDTQIVAEQDCHSNGLFIGNVAIQERCVIWRPIWCVSPRRLEMLLPSAIRWIRGVKFSAARCSTTLLLKLWTHWHNNICTTMKCLPSRTCLKHVVKKVKQSHYRSGGWGSQISRQSAQEGGKVVGPTHRSPLPSGDIPSTLFC